MTLVLKNAAADDCAVAAVPAPVAGGGWLGASAGRPARHRPDEALKLTKEDNSMAERGDPIRRIIGVPREVPADQPERTPAPERKPEKEPA